MSSSFEKNPTGKLWWSYTTLPITGEHTASTASFILKDLASSSSMNFLIAYAVDT
jgi:hypothetical protein